MPSKAAPKVNRFPVAVTNEQKQLILDEMSTEEVKRDEFIKRNTEFVAIEWISRRPGVQPEIGRLIRRFVKKGRAELQKDVERYDKDAGPRVLALFGAPLAQFVESSTTALHISLTQYNSDCRTMRDPDIPPWMCKQAAERAAEAQFGFEQVAVSAAFSDRPAVFREAILMALLNANVKERSGIKKRLLDEREPELTKEGFKILWHKSVQMDQQKCTYALTQSTFTTDFRHYLVNVQEHLARAGQYFKPNGNRERGRDKIEELLDPETSPFNREMLLREVTAAGTKRRIVGAATHPEQRLPQPRTDMEPMHR